MIASHILAKIEERTKKYEKQEGRRIKESVKSVIKLIPSVIAENILKGKSSACVMTLKENKDYTAPWWYWLCRKPPEVTSLKTVSAAVFAWCQEAGLEPSLTPGIFFNYRGVESKIVVSWTRDSLPLITGINRRADSQK